MYIYIKLYFNYANINLVINMYMPYLSRVCIYILSWLANVTLYLVKAGLNATESLGKITKKISIYMLLTTHYIIK